MEIKALERTMVMRHHHTTVHRDKVQFPSGTEGDYLYIERDTSVAVLTLIGGSNDLSTLLVRQFRYPIGRVVYQFPMGFLEQGIAPEEQARRELLEETGYRAVEMAYITEFFHDPGLNTQRSIVYRSRDPILTGSQQLDDTESIAVECVPVKALSGMVQDGTICDALTISLVYLLLQDVQGR